ncbi:ABC transporter permease [Nostocoides sp. Soil756]|jgi:spermidine/putrescine transport system permease protein|uniref:ABC transporter permease n=1 Tax=Nostocoides sp. Soil756 TaxID=1736399 RepID=UPI0006F78377|nr:ABC transporter permease [Tetrasphaera sp. Soil756]KRE61638.1 ABC transporter permease [Tetrasphaera sp. Soil756]
MSWLRRHTVQVIGLLVMAYILLPNLVVLAFSFNKPNGRLNITWQEFSFDAWLNPCDTPGICSSVGLSLKIGIIASLTATVLGTLVAFALGRHRFRGRAGTNVLIFMPMATPEVVMGSSLLTLFIALGVGTGQTTILIAHIMFCLSFVVVTVKARIASLDPRLEEAAADLYASPAQAFRRVTLPLVAPGIAAGALLAFSLSFDDYIITNFNASPSSVTFPMYIWGAAQRGVPVQVNVIGSVLFLAAVAFVGIGQLLAAGRQRARA